MGKLPRIIRIIFATISFVVITCGFLNMSGGNPLSQAFLKTQFIPALISLFTGSFIAFAILLVITLLFGRVYCSFLCPLGIFQDIIYWISNIARKISNKGRIPLKNYSKPHNVLRYSILGISGICFAIGFTYPLALLDPYSNYGKIAVQIFGSIENGITNLLSGVLPSVFYHQEYLAIGIHSFYFSLIFLLIILILSAVKGRLYCNTICPVGSFLGLISGFSLFKPVIDKEKCVQCNLCAGKCKSNCINLKTKEIDVTRCVACYDCLTSCKRGGVKLSAVWFKNNKDNSRDIENKERREALIAMGGFAAAVVAKSVVPKKLKADSLNDSLPILPPGAKDITHFKDSCTACHACIAACPSKVLRPSSFEYGIEGIMLPTVKFNKKYCSYNCNICSQVCPNGAISHISLEQKRKTQIGLAVYNPSNCVIISDDIHCGACAGNCPTGAIEMAHTPAVPGKLLPKIDPMKCIGCGACEYTCPGIPKAIIVKGKSIQTEI